MVGTAPMTQFDRAFLSGPSTNGLDPFHAVADFHGEADAQDATRYARGRRCIAPVTRTDSRHSGHRVSQRHPAGPGPSPAGGGNASTLLEAGPKERRGLG